MHLKAVCADGATTPGIDIYHGDYIEDINKVIASGVQYVYLKAWENTIDSSFKSRWESMRNHKVIRGAYDFFHPGKDPIKQADGFLSTMDSLLPDDLPCALDWEVTDGASNATQHANALKWLEYIEAKTRKTPVIYTSSAFTTLDSRFDRFSIWIANYGVTCPHLPVGRTRWDFWQSKGDSGRVPGMRGACDMDVFNGDLDALKAFVKKSTRAPQ
jgi:lysozyme